MNALARFAVLVTLPFVILVSGCSSQQEGERCDQPSDCETGLSCQAISGNTYSVCCPVSGLSTIASCNPGTVTVDAGTSDANDAAPEAEAESPEAEASTEVDAAEDGGAE
jgi:hypothetical protein